MLARIRNAGRLLWRTIDACQRDDTPFLAAGLSFYTVLSLAPALWLVTAIVGAWAGRESARAQIIKGTTELAGSDAAGFVSRVVDQVEATSSLATVVGLVSMFFGATLAFGSLYDSLNRIWKVIPPPDRGFIRGYLTKRLLAFVLVLLMGILMLLSLLLTATVAAAARFVPDSLPATGFAIEAINFVISMGLMFVLFAAIYAILHDHNIDNHDVWIGAGVTAVLFAIGKSLLALYLASTGLTSAYGAAGSVVVLLLWVYYSAQIFLFGAEFTELYSRARKRR